ncbi:MAG: DNA alkylation repair protein [Proteobacteria bacterium]|nr:DNA alkylation repair protein [Pseudomonadota bacterium]
MRIDEILKELKKESDSKDLEGMARVGITPDRAFGTKLPVLRKLAKRIGKDHDLAIRLWNKGYRETQILAAMLDEPGEVTQEQMDSWARDFSYWEICDQCCMNLFYLLPFAMETAIAWTQEKDEQLKRAGFALMAVMAWKDKEAKDKVFIELFPYIKEGSKDERGPVKKAVSWSLRNIGKRNLSLNRKAVKLAKTIDKLNLKPAKWVAKDVLRELTDEKQLNRLK